MNHPRRVPILAAVGVSTIALAGCFTGERPILEEDRPASSQEGLSTGSDDIDLVLQRLESVDEATFTAEYDIDTRFGSVASTGVVVQTDADRRAVTVERAAATTRFVLDGTTEQTCNLLTDECESSINDALISDTQLSNAFYGPSFARRLRVSADRRIGNAASYTKQIAGQDARCVDVDVSGGTETFCALDSGVLAEFVGADVTIELTEYSAEPDASQFTTT